MDNLELSLWGLSLSAKGAVAICAAVAIVTMFFAVCYFTRS
jgi:hypothetical protein